MFYFSSPKPPFYHFDTEHDNFTRWSIFLIFAECVGLPVLVWALTVLHRHRKHNGRVSVFIVLLLLNDLIALLLNPYVATILLQSYFCWDTITCRVLYSLWSGSRHCGVYLQQMMVLESVLTLRSPHCFAHSILIFCSIILSAIAYDSFFLCEYFMAHFFLLLGLFPLFAVTVTSWTLTCRTPPVNKHSSKETKKQDWTVLVYATITVMLYLMSLSLYSVVNIWTLFTIIECLLSLRVVIDPLLCVLVCRQEQTHTSSDLSTEHTAVQAELSV